MNSTSHTRPLWHFCATFLPGILAGIFAGLLVSCASKPPEEKEPAVVVKEVVKKEVAPVEPADPTAGWMTLKDDTKLPTEEQLADGAESSIGKSQPDAGDASSPSTTIKPPRSIPEDKLAPSQP